MKKMIIALMAVVMSVGVASAQNYMVIDSEKVFKSVAAYNEALEDIEQLATQYQDAVDKKFAEVENLYNSYMQQRSSLSMSAQQQYEQLILQKEAEATEYQESLFGTDGTLMNKRLELIQPIQERVFNTIESFSKQYGYDLVIDISANPTILYYSTKVDFTDRIIEALKK
ncbi:MAG: OmpH family outer membrane protein [Alistipes sp.]|jgi:outer membrane protein|nr:OmpH family outer membrane protein [Alistipes sp.]MBR5771366.1 OmpH family outer membrane protein [Alistipes sp.]